MLRDDQQHPAFYRRPGYIEASKVSGSTGTAKASG